MSLPIPDVGKEESVRNLKLKRNNVFYISFS